MAFSPGFEERGVEILDVLIPDALVGVVAEGVGGDGVEAPTAWPLTPMVRLRCVGSGECDAKTP